MNVKTATELQVAELQELRRMAAAQAGRRRAFLPWWRRVFHGLRAAVGRVVHGYRVRRYSRLTWTERCAVDDAWLAKAGHAIGTAGRCRPGETPPPSSYVAGNEAELEFIKRLEGEAS